MLQYMSTFVNNIAYGTDGVVQTAQSDVPSYDQQSQAIVLGLTTALSSNRTNDIHLQAAYDNRQEAPRTSAAEIDIGDLFNIGGVAGGTYLHRAIREELVDNYSVLLGKHSFKFGVDVNLEPETQQREYYPNGLWTIDTFEDYLAALPVGQGGGGQSIASISRELRCGNQHLRDPVRAAPTRWAALRRLHRLLRKILPC
jgi:hypothetical protein